jgi:site-specific DNA-methyltransferase (adenine-specific)
MIRPYYEQDGITIYHGDCREILPEIQSGIVVTDPPYGMKKAAWDSIVPVSEWLPLARNIGPVLLFCGVIGMRDYPPADWTLAWVRLGSTQRNGALRGFNNWEPILMWGLPSLRNDTISLAHVPDGVNGHPTPKPVKLMSRVIGLCPEGTIVDPFCGTGTTLVAAKSARRSAIGIDTEERYCEMAVKRLRQRVLPLAADAVDPQVGVSTE